MPSRLRRAPNDNSVPLDMTPMIDCIFLLLIFFILTSKFVPDDLAIVSLMPTDKGTATSPDQAPIPPPHIAIKIFPAGMVRGFQPSDYRNQLAALRPAPGRPIERVWIQVGGDDPIEVEGAPLRQPGSAAVARDVDRLHAHLHQALAARESADGTATPPVVIHCFSGLSWKYALLAYDAVREHERLATGGPLAQRAADLRGAREVSFAPPRLRNYSPNEFGDELHEIVHQH